MNLRTGERCTWENLRVKNGTELGNFYTQLLRTLSSEKGMLGQIFNKSQNKLQDPAKLLKIIAPIDKENCTLMGANIKGKIYEGLLEKNAEDTKSVQGNTSLLAP